MRQRVFVEIIVKCAMQRNRRELGGDQGIDAAAGVAGLVVGRQQ